MFRFVCLQMLAIFLYIISIFLPNMVLFLVRYKRKIWRRNQRSVLYSHIKYNRIQARLAQSVERQALNLVVGGSSPPVGAFLFLFSSFIFYSYFFYFFFFFLSFYSFLTHIQHFALIYAIRITIYCLSSTVGSCAGLLTRWSGVQSPWWALLFAFLLTLFF